MSRQLENVLRAKGPFYGLNEKIDETILGKRYARSLSNVLLFRKKIQPRHGIKKVFENVYPEGFPSDVAALQGYVFIPESTGPDRALATLPLTAIVVIYGQRIDVVLIDPERTPSPVFEKGLSLNGFNISGRGTIIQFNRTIVYAFEPNRPYVHRSALTSFDDFHPAGLEPPSGVNGEVFPVPIGGIPMPKGVYRFSVSYYNSATRTESNVTQVSGGGEFVRADQETLQNVFVFSGSDWMLFKFPNQHPKGATHVRVYAEILELDLDPTAEFIGPSPKKRLVEELPISTSPGDTLPREVLMRILKIQPIATPETTLSTKDSGPFEPTLNGTPPISSAAVVYNDMVLYGSVETGSYGAILYSEPGQAEHVHPLDSIAFEDAGTQKITAMVVYQGRVIIFKQNAIYVLAGTINRQTNNAAANAEPRPLQNFQVFRILSTPGCFNIRGGIGTMECEGFLYLNAEDGIYVFDGQVARKVSEAIDDTFLAIPEEMRSQCTMANDTENGLLWIAYARTIASSTETPVLLCYDYRHKDPQTGLGSWTVHDVDGLGFVITPQPSGEGLPVLNRKGTTLVGRHHEIGPDKVFQLGQMDPDTLDDFGETFDWHYETVPLDHGLPDRNKRYHYLTVDYERSIQPVTIKSLVDTEIKGTVTKEKVIETKFKQQKKVRIGGRGHRISIRFEGESKTAPRRKSIVGGKKGSPVTAEPARAQADEKLPKQVRINGFSIDAEPIGRR